MNVSSNSIHDLLLKLSKEIKKKDYYSNKNNIHAISSFHQRALNMPSEKHTQLHQ